MKGLFIILLLCVVITCQKSWTSVGMSYNFYQTGEINFCSNTIKCYEYFEDLRHNPKVFYACFGPNDLYQNCEFNQTVNDDTIYVSFCVMLDPDGGSNRTIIKD